MEKAARELRRFNYLIGEIDKLYHRAALKLGQSDSALAVLYTLCSEGRCGISEVCHLSGMSKQTVNSALRKLEAEGVVKLEAVDGRKKQISLTAKGSRLAAKTAARVVEAENRVFAGWSESDRAEYLRLTEKYLCDFKNEVDNL
ncbi:MAG: MarR family winged helix-turn-helix transcriptional regulator [Oscillospiraceae bacterium]|nr:MarR family winged helix-turn-helix transcriptional regulator [Oscillospiraceae bacterium]